jgi:hypothetical protein
MLTQAIEPTPSSDDDGLSSLRLICADPKIHTLTLPLIRNFYGPASYPALKAFPGCSAPNARQQIQAPGLLNCSALGVEIQHCQTLGKRVLLSVKGSSVSSVGGNTAFGDPRVKSDVLGQTFGDGKQKRDEETGDPLPVFNITSAKPPYKPLVMGHGPVIFNGSLPKSSSVAMPTPIDTPVVVVQVNPLPSSTSPTSAPASTSTFFPNLFDPRHPPTSFALTLFSLFSEGHTERSDLRPLGPEPPSDASPPVLNGTNWITPAFNLERPLGEEVVVDGFDVQLPAEWKGSYQDGQFKDFVRRMKEYIDEAWMESGGVVGGPNDLGADGKGSVYSGYVGGALKTRSLGLKVTADLKRVGWYEWDPMV